MSTYEHDLKEKIKDVKRRIYFSAPPAPACPPRAADPGTFVTRQRIDKNASWVRSMKVDRRPRIVTIEMIKRVVCKHFKMKQGHLISDRRSRDVVRPRQLGMWLARELTSRSLPQIGKAFGNRDHTTVLHAIAKINQLVADEKEDVAWTINVLTEEIYQELH